MPSVWPSSTTVCHDTHALRWTYGGGCFLDWGIMEATERAGEAWGTKESFKLSRKGKRGRGWGDTPLATGPNLAFALTV